MMYEKGDNDDEVMIIDEGVRDALNIEEGAYSAIELEAGTFKVYYRGKVMEVVECTCESIHETVIRL